MDTFKVILFFLIISITGVGQTLSIKEVLSFTKTDQESLSNLLTQKGWSNHNFEMVADSNFNRRTWVKENPNNNLKSYIMHYDFGKDTAENYLVYQFFDRAAVKDFKDFFNDQKFKKIKSKHKKDKKNKHDKNIHKEYTELYYSDVNNSVILLKDVFFYGMNTFLIYSYRFDSAIGKNIRENFNH